MTVQSGDLQTHLRAASDAIKKKDINRAIECYVAASESLGNSNSLILLNLAGLYSYNRQMEEAKVYYKYCLALEPNNVDAMKGYALCLVKDHKLFDAIALIEKCMSLDPRNESIAGELFKLYLRSNQFQKAALMRPITPSLYDKNISGKSIFLDIDKVGNGLGDMFQYIRYAKVLKESGAQVTVKAMRQLEPLLRLCPYIDRIIHKSPDMSEFDNDYSICIATLMILTQQEVSYRISQPYLYASEALQALWRKRINPSEFNIGICWEASPYLDGLTGEVVANPRTVHAKEFSVFKNMQGIRFYSLQKQILCKPDIPITYFDTDFDESHGWFMDSAALIKNLDLVITVDTAIAHLAGALGVPVWVMLISDCDFRWLEDTTDSMWYPRMRLFRQKKFGDWATVLAEIKQELMNVQWL